MLKTILPSLPRAVIIRIIYLGVFLIQSRSFKCSLDNAKKSFYRSANTIFGKIGRTASEDVVIHLTKSKCVPCLMYGLNACYLSKSQLNSLDFTINRLFMKLFKTNNLDLSLIHI